MLFIAFSLLGGWILSFFGFQAVVIAGMSQLFGVTITSLGYYFLFAMLGVLNRLAILLNRNRISRVEAFEGLQESVEDLKKSKENLNHTRKGL